MLVKPEFIGANKHSAASSLVCQFLDVKSLINGITANKELIAGKTPNRKNSIVNKSVYSVLSLATKPLAIYSFSLAVSALVKPITIYPALDINEEAPL